MNINKEALSSSIFSEILNKSYNRTIYDFENEIKEAVYLTLKYLEENNLIRYCDDW